MKNPVNNYDIIKNYLDFSNLDNFYYAQIMQRRKDNKYIKTNHTHLCSFYINSLEYFESIFPTIKSICDATKSRCYISLDAKSIKLAALKTNSKIAEQLINESYFKVRDAFQSTCGSLGARRGITKTWVIDLDNADLKKTLFIKKYLETLEPKGDKVVLTLPTHTGYHLITRGFDCRDLLHITMLDIHKNGSTLLYYNNSSN